MHDGLGPAWHATMIVIAASTVDGDGGGIHQLIFLPRPDLRCAWGRLGTLAEAKAPKHNPPILHVPTVIAELARVMITWRSSHPGIDTASHRANPTASACIIGWVV